MLTYDPTRVALYSPERRETLFNSAVEYSGTQLAIEAARLAYVHAERSVVERQRLNDALARVGFSDVGFFDQPATQTQAFAAYRASDATALIAFRGTQPDETGDLKIDLRARLIAWRDSSARVHEGFAIAFLSVRAQLESWLDAHSQRRSLILAGHSLGAALATLGAALWRPSFLCTLGSPRVGDGEFVRALADTSIVRIVNCCDVVTDVPPPVAGYMHVAPRLYIARDGDVIADPSDAFVASDRSQADIDYLQRYSWKITENVLTRRLADHAPINYARAFFEEAVSA